MIISFLWKKNHYICIPAIDIDSILKTDKKVYPQAYLKECKYKSRKRKLVSFIDYEIIDDSDIMKLLMEMVMTVIMKMIFNILFFSKCI